MKAADRRGISEVAAAIILIMVVVVSAIIIWNVLFGLGGLAESVRVDAFLVQDEYVGGKQVFIVTLRISNGLDSIIELNQVTARLTHSDGTVTTVLVTPTAGADATGSASGVEVTVSGLQDLKIPGGDKTELSIIITADINLVSPLASAVFEIDFVDTASQQTFRVTSNEVELS